jgi:hypothetical protein
MDVAGSQSDEHHAYPVYVEADPADRTAPQSAKPDLIRENAELRAALRREGDMNHIERCTAEWPHDGACHHPPPDLLGSEVAVDAVELP